MNAKIYGLDSSLIHDANPKDGFVVDMVRADAYLALEQERDRLQEQVKALAADNVVMKSAISYVRDVDNQPDYQYDGMGCGIEDRGIVDRYEAARYGWDEAIERLYNEVISFTEDTETPATDAFIAEIKAQGVDEFGQYHNFSEKQFIQKEAIKFAAQLRAKPAGEQP